MLAGKSKKAPTLTLLEAENIIREINSIAGAESLSEDSLPEIVKSSKTSSLFERKLNALKNYGLIKDTGNSTIAVSSLGMKIINPLDEEEADESRKYALLRIDPLQQLINRYPGGRLPPDDSILSHVLQREYGILPAHVDKWLEYIRNSFRILEPLLGEKGKEKDSNNGQEQENKQEILPQGEIGFFKLQLPLSSGSVAQIIIPKDATMSDKEMIITIIDAVKFKDDDE